MVLGVVWYWSDMVLGVVWYWEWHGIGSGMILG